MPGGDNVVDDCDACVGGDDDEAIIAAIDFWSWTRRAVFVKLSRAMSTARCLRSVNEVSRRRVAFELSESLEMEVSSIRIWGPEIALRLSADEGLDFSFIEHSQ